MEVLLSDHALVVFEAMHSARSSLQHERMGSSHLLLALANFPGKAAAAIEEAGIDRTALYEIVRSQHSDNELVDAGSDITTEFACVMGVADELRSQSDEAMLDTDHLLLAVLETPESTAWQILDGLGVDEERLAQLITEQ